MKKIISITLALVCLMSLCACGKTAEPEPATAPEATPVIVEIEKNYILADGCTVNGSSQVEFTEPGDYTAAVELPEHKRLDYWVLNGETVEGEEGTEFAFHADGPTTVRAVLRDEKRVVTINARMFFTGEIGGGVGEGYTEFSFEEPYEHPVLNKTIDDGTITAYIMADIPPNKAVDYWLINGIEYRLEANRGFKVCNLDEYTVYECVLRDYIPIGGGGGGSGSVSVLGDIPTYIVN